MNQHDVILDENTDINTDNIGVPHVVNLEIGSTDNGSVTKKQKINNFDSELTIPGIMDQIDNSNSMENLTEASNSDFQASRHETLDKVNETCLVCFESNSSTCKLLDNHDCPQCVANAWSICERCNENLLSRTCPVCRSDYKALTLFAISEVSVQAITQPKCAEDFKYQMALLSTIKTIIKQSNVAVWIPNENKMMFSLPKDSNSECIVAKIKIDSGKVSNGMFEFTNKIWDELENQAENSNEEDLSCEMISTGQSLKRLFEALKIPNSVLLTPIENGVLDYKPDIVAE